MVLSAATERLEPWARFPHLPPEILALKAACAAGWYTTEFLLVSRVGSVSTTAISNLNRVASIAFSLLLFQNGVSSVQILGFGMTLAGVVAYHNDLAERARDVDPAEGHLAPISTDQGPDTHAGTGGNGDTEPDASPRPDDDPEAQKGAKAGGKGKQKKKRKKEGKGKGKGKGNKAEGKGQPSANAAPATPAD